MSDAAKHAWQRFAPLLLKRDVLVMTALRGGAMGGKLLFVVFAATYMSEADFGRWGLIASLTLALVALAGLEAYQLFIRQITQSTGEEADQSRRTYATFALLAPFASGITAGLLAAWLGWGTNIALLVAALVALEHLGIEVFRILVAEARASLATLNLFMRSGSWAIILPTLTLTGIASQDWSLELVLTFWLAADLVALLPFLVVARAYLPNAESIASFLPAITGILRKVLPWIVGIVSWRLLEGGGRFVVAAFEGEAASGRFTLVSMFAIVNLLLAKGIIEPLYLSRLLSENSDHTMRMFRLSLWLMVAIGSCISLTFGFAYHSYVSTLSTTELVSLLILTAAFGALSISVSAHLELYRAHQDRRLAAVNAIALAASVLGSLPGTYWMGLPGTSAGLLAGCLLLAVLKRYYANRLETP